MDKPELRCVIIAAFIKYNSDESRSLFCVVCVDCRHRYPWNHSGTAAIYFWRKIKGGGSELLDRLLIKKILIRLRKRAYSTLR
jgi:hypothetical protein